MTPPFSAILRMEPGRAFVGLEGSQHPKQGERVKHIHNRAALDEIDGARRVFSCAFRKDLKPTAIDHRHDSVAAATPTKRFKD